MSYSNPKRTIFTFPLFDFGGGADAYHTIKGPKGKKGRLYDAGVCGPAEAFAAGTLLPQISVGTVADRDAYMEEFSLGALALATPKSLRSTYDEGSEKTSFDAVMVNPVLPADTPVAFHLIAGTGSGLTGQAIPFIIIDWDD